MILSQKRGINNMIDIKKKGNELLDKVRKYFVGTDKLESANKSARKKWLNLGLVIMGAFIAFLVLLFFIASNEKKQNAKKGGDDLTSIANNRALSHLLKIVVKAKQILDFRHYDAMSILKFSKA